MTYYFNVETEINRQRRLNFKHSEQRPVLMGDGRGRDPAVNLYADKQRLWVRNIGGADSNGFATAGLPYTALAGVGPTPEIDKLVWIEWQVGPQEWRIIMSDPDHMQETGRSSHLENPTDPHNQYHRTEQLLPLRAQWIGGLEISVQGYQFVDEDGNYGDYPGTSGDAGAISQYVDATSHVPGTAAQHRYLVVAFNPAEFLDGNEPLSVFTSTAQSWFTDLDDTDLQEGITAMRAADVRNRPVWAFRVATGDTDNRGHEDDRDLRQWLNLPGGNGSGAPADATYILQTADPDLPSAQPLDALTDGLLKKTAGGVLATAISNTDYVPPSGAVLDSPTINTAISGSAIDNDGTLTANSATKVATQQAVKSYVDAVAQGLSVKQSVVAATTSALPANTYNNGASGVGATITANANGALTIDGQAIALNDRVLIKDEATAANNGIYVCTTAGSGGAAFVLTRATDMNQAAEIPGAFTFVENGTVNDAAGFVVADPGPFTIGTTAIPWTQFSGAGQIVAGSGLSKTGNTLAVDSTVVRTTGAQAVTDKALDGSTIGTTTPAAGYFSALRLLIGGIAAIFTHAFTANRTVTLPGDADVTLVGESTTQNISNKTINNSSIGLTTQAAGYFSALRLYIGGFFGAFTHANTANRTYTLPNYNATLSPMTTQGDLTYHTGTDNARLARGTAYQYVRMNSAGTLPIYDNGFTVVWQAFTTPGADTWTKPANCQFVLVICIGGGGGGGSGRRGAGGTNRFGGGGGGAGALTEMWFLASQLGATEVIEVGPGGTGGAARTTNDTNGVSGSDGGISYFGGNSRATAKLGAKNGTGGGGGTNAAGGAGGAGNTTLNAWLQFYGSDGATGTTSSTNDTTNAARGPGGGGSGGGQNTASVSGNGGAGAPGTRAAFTATATTGGTGSLPGAGTNTGNDGADGTVDGTTDDISGSGGGGGSFNGGDGGAGGFPGGGGGGGGCSTNGTDSGDGGAGGDGCVIVISYCR
jgi:hypothetical protein